MLSLAEAWHWAQIGFCVSLGASLFAVGLASVFSGGRREEEYPERTARSAVPTRLRSRDHNRSEAMDS